MDIEKQNKRAAIVEYQRLLRKPEFYPINLCYSETLNLYFVSIFFSDEYLKSFNNKILKGDEIYNLILEAMQTSTEDMEQKDVNFNRH